MCSKVHTKWPIFRKKGAKKLLRPFFRQERGSQFAGILCFQQVRGSFAKGLVDGIGGFLGGGHGGQIHLDLGLCA